MRLLLLIAVAVTTSLPLRAQTTPDSSGLSVLDAEIRASTIPTDLYYRQLEDAWDRAVVAGQYGRADSVAVLAEVAVTETTGLPRDSVVWPGVGDRLAVGLLSGDPAAVEALAADGAWWRSPTSVPLWQSDVFVYTAGPRLTLLPFGRFALRPSNANVLAQDSSRAVERLAANGADKEAVAVARLAIGKLLVNPDWMPGPRDPALSDDQIALNTRADAFLERYPASRFERFVREAVRLRYRVDGAVSLFLGLGPGWGTGGVGEATGFSIAGEVGVGVRYGWLHADFGFHGTDLRVTDTRFASGQSLVEDDRLTIALIGVDVGPRVALGGLDVLPYVSGGLLLQNISGPEVDEPELSTYEFPNRLGWGYGVALEYLGGRWQRYGGTAIRLRAGRLVPRFTDGFEEVLEGPVTYVSLGATLTGVLRTRLD